MSRKCWCWAPCCFVLKTVLMIVMTIRGGETPARVPKLRSKTGSGDQRGKNCSNYQLYSLAIARATLSPLTISLWNTTLEAATQFSFFVQTIGQTLIGDHPIIELRFILPAESPLSNCYIMTAWRLDTCLNCSARLCNACNKS